MLDIDKGMPEHSLGATRTAPANRTERPTVSLISLAHDCSAAALHALVSRAQRWEHLGIELIVVCTGRSYAESSFSAISGGARLIHGPPRAAEQQLRAIGFAAATGDVVVFLEDLDTADDRWIEHMKLTGSVMRPRLLQESGEGAPSA